MSNTTELFDIQRIIDNQSVYDNAEPFPHLVLDEFLPFDLAEDLSSDFPKIGDDKLFEYNNPLEIKKALNDWNSYPPSTYKFLQFLNSEPVISALSKLTGVKLYPDHGLHGGGWHMHGNGGKLNPHLDYSIHPKLGLQRKLNLIVYLTKDWEADWGGSLGLWSHNAENNTPNLLKKEVQIEFNKVLLFDTTCNSWHGISRPISCPQGYSRNSIAVYYLAEPAVNAPERSRALYAPTADQKDNVEILDLIRKRVDLKESKSIYK